MDEPDAFEAAANWYRDVMLAVAVALHEIALPTGAAADFIASLRRQGWEINRVD